MATLKCPCFIQTFAPGLVDLRSKKLNFKALLYRNDVTFSLLSLFLHQNVYFLLPTRCFNLLAIQQHKLYILFWPIGSLFVIRRCPQCESKQSYLHRPVVIHPSSTPHGSQHVAEVREMQVGYVSTRAYGDV